MQENNNVEEIKRKIGGVTSLRDLLLILGAIILVFFLLVKSTEWKKFDADEYLDK